VAVKRVHSIGCLLVVRCSKSLGSCYLKLPVICTALVCSAFPLILGRSGKHYTAATCPFVQEDEPLWNRLMVKELPTGMFQFMLQVDRQSLFPTNIHRFRHFLHLLNVFLLIPLLIWPELSVIPHPFLPPLYKCLETIVFGLPFPRFIVGVQWNLFLSVMFFHMSTSQRCFITVFWTSLNGTVEWLVLRFHNRRAQIRILTLSWLRFSLVSINLSQQSLIYRMSEEPRTNGNFVCYLHYMAYMSTHFLSRFPMFVRILLNILGSTVAQQTVIQDVWH
jgi:hypothetical protein